MANEWELSKENVQPLKQGRIFSSLSSALQPSVQEQLKKEKQEFEAELRTYSGDDPLDVWYRYIKWTEQAHPKGGKNSKLTPILERCLGQFKDVQKYKNDSRYIEAWIQYANLCMEPQDIFSFMYDQSIGRKSADFFEAWAWSFEQVGNTKRADRIYQEGIKNQAEPTEVLQRKHVDFQKRIARGLMMEPEESSVEVLDEQRTALGHLKTTGKQNKVGVNRIGAAKQSSRGGLGLKMGLSQVGQSFPVFNDENQDPSQFPSQAGQWSKAPQASALNKENTQKPGVWTKAKVPQKGISVPIHEVNTHSKPSFTVHVEDNADQAMMTPRKLPEIGSQVLSARKPEKPVDPLHYLREQEQNNPQLKPMYCKHKIYCGAEEYTFEELRAARWKAKKKKEEDQKRIEEEEKALEEQRQNLRKTREMFLEQEETLKQQQLILKQEQEAMIAQYRQHLKEQQEQFEKERLLQFQKQQEMLEKDIQHRMMQQLTVSNNSGISPKENFSINSDKEFVQPQPSVHSLHQNPNQSLNSSNRLSQSLNNSNRTPSYRGHLNESQSSGKLSHPSTGPTPDSSCRRSLTAPSPTVCTKEAMQLVMGMFNASLDIDKHLGWTGDDTSSNVPVPAAVNKVEPVSAASQLPFTIYDESSVPKQSSVGSNQSNKENDENRLLQEYPLAPKRKGLGGGGFLKASVESSETGRDLVMAMDFHVDQDSEKMEGIESQAHDDVTIAPVCSHQSFAAAARFASTPFHPNISRGTLPDVSQINGLDHTDKDNMVDSKVSTSQLDSKASILNPLLVSENGSKEQPKKSFYFSEENEENKNLSPIMEGSNEDSSGHHTNAAASIFTTTGNHSSIHHKQLSNNTDVHQQLDFREEEREYSPILEEINQSTHVIDTTAYIPPDFHDPAEASIMIDPHNPFDEDQIEMFLSNLSQPLTSLPNYFTFDYNISEIREDNIVTIGSEVYIVEKLVGKGGYAKVYKVSSLQYDDITDFDFDGEDKQHVALKVQSPPCRWEFYICHEIQRRLTLLNDPVDVRPAMMSISKAFVYEDASCLVTQFFKKGTLLDLVNCLMKYKVVLQEWLAVYVTIELLHMMEKLHACQVIHGDIKPDNFLFIGLPDLQSSSNPQEIFEGRRRCLHLIDFGQAIDMTKYPPGTTFMAKVKTQDFQCIEMKTDQPWTYQTDLFGLAGTIHVLLFGKYMKIYQDSGEWRMTSTVVRKWNVPLWKKLFHQLLNIKSCSELPDLSALRKEFEHFFAQELICKYMKEYDTLNIEIAQQF